ncbi:MAG TPA: zf-HC2 domain-containing protein [Prolixibacteraceae bacterium]|nr:zf-HC2 domain-containing protein [Prolixibacteraceae bacterium]
MNCIDEQLLQKYIDGECTESEMLEVKQHLFICLACTQSLAEKEKVSLEIKRALNSLTADQVEIPVFRNINKRLVNKNINLLIYSLSAACILLLVLFIVGNEFQPNQKEITIVQSVPVEVDANRPASDQEFVIEVYDGKGQRSEYFIE